MKRKKYVFWPDRVGVIFCFAEKLISNTKLPVMSDTERSYTYYIL